MTPPQLRHFLHAGKCSLPESPPLAGRGGVSSPPGSAAMVVRWALAALRLAPAPLLLATASCAGGSPEVPRTTQRDSAGLVIVENEGSLPANSGGWSVTRGPTLSIGTVEGDDAYQFFGVAGTHRFDDGRIGVVNAGSRQVRTYGPDGSLLTSYGRPGAGPEEFDAPVLAGVMGHQLMVVDRAHHRMAFVDPDQGFVALVRISDEVGGYLNPIGSFANGQAVFGGAFDMRRFGELKNGLNRAHTFYRSSNPDGSLATDFGDKDGAEFFVKDLEGSGPDARPVLTPFAKLPMAAVSPHHFFFSAQDAYEIQVYEPSGRLARLIRLTRDPVPVSPVHGERYIESAVEQIGDPNQAAALRAQLGSLPLPEFFPPHGAMLADLLGFLWVEDFQRPGEEDRTWNVFSPEGALSGRLTLPETFSPREIGADYVLGVGWDELDVEYVRMYGLSRPLSPLPHPVASARRMTTRRAQEWTLWRPTVQAESLGMPKASSPAVVLAARMVGMKKGRRKG
jgi:hypothetical protein